MPFADSSPDSGLIRVFSFSLFLLFHPILSVILDEAIELLYDLHPGTTPVEEGSPNERRHKPLLQKRERGHPKAVKVVGELKKAKLITVDDKGAVTYML